MKPRRILLAIAILAMLIAVVSGCPSGGDGEGAEAEGPPEGGPAGPPSGEGGPPAPPGGPGGGPGGPPAPPGGPQAGPPGGPSGGPAGPGGPGQGAEAGPPMGESGAPSPAASMDEIVKMKHDGDYTEAAKELDKVLSSDSENARAHWVLAWVLAEQGKTYNNPSKVDEARQHFQRFIELSDDQSKISEAEAALDRLEE